MAQYCRYCANMVWGDSFYCEVKNKCFAESTVKSVNRCKSFELNPYDVIDIDKEYKPREPKPKQVQGQMTFAEARANMNDHLLNATKKVEDKQYCSTCKWYDIDNGVCCNGESEHRADFRCLDDSCDKWQEESE